MNTKSIVVMLAVVLFPLSAAAFDADEERHYRAAAELLEVLGMENKAAETVEALVAEHQRDSSPSPVQVDRVRTQYVKYLGWDALENEMLDLFTAEFSEKEIRIMTEFYRTETGRKALTMVPQLYREGLSMAKERAMKHIEKGAE